MHDIFDEVFECDVLGVHIVYADVSKLDLDMEYPCISEYRKAKLAKLRQAKDKRLALGAELLLVYAIDKYYPDIALPLDIKANEKGKPEIVGMPWVKFNLSHAQNVAACVIGDREVGIDVESTLRENRGIAERYYSEKERGLDFAFIWTRKEALAKACGDGIAMGLDTFDVSGDTVTLGGKTYTLKTIDSKISGVYISLCVI